MAEASPEPTASRSPRVLVVDDERSIVDFIRLGLQYEGFLVQTAPDGQAALRRRNPTAGPQLHVQDVTMDDATREVRRDGRAIDLSAREFDLLRLLMMQPDQVLPRDRILDQVWGYNFFGDANNVEVYIRYLRQKLGDEQHQLIQTVRGVGYRIKT